MGLYVAYKINILFRIKGMPFQKIIMVNYDFLKNMDENVH